MISTYHCMILLFINIGVPHGCRYWVGYSGFQVCMGGLKQAFCHLVIIKGKFIGCEDSQHNHHAVLPVHNTGKTVY